MKKLSAILLSLCLLFSAFPFSTAFAHSVYTVDATGETRKVVVSDLDAYISYKFDKLAYPFYEWGDLYLNDKKVTEVTIPSSLEQFDTNSLKRCQSIEKVTVEEGVKVIGESAFYQNTNLKSISLPSTLKRIESGAFDYCRSLKEIVIPDSVTYIGYSSFFTDPVLESITIPFIGETSGNDERDYFGEIFSDKTYVNGYYMFVKYVTLSNKCTVIPDNAFIACDSIETVTVPASVKKIGENAFDGCGDDVVIKCYKGSLADDYCKKNNIAVEYIGSVCSTGHNFGKYTVTINPFCEQKGSRERSCTVCGYTETSEMAATGHKYEEERISKQPTCTEKGTRTLKCSVCSSRTTEEVAALGHNFEDPTIVKEATETSTGLKEGRCARCNETTEEVIPMLSSSSSSIDLKTEPSSSSSQDKDENSSSVKDDNIYGGNNASTENILTQSDANGQEAELMPKENSGGWIVWVISGAIALIAGAGVATFLILKKKKVSVLPDSTDPPDTTE